MHFDAARPAPDDPALLYSLAEFREVIFAAFEAAGVRTIVEIGAEGGLFTERLVQWAAGHHGRLVSIDPVPGEQVRALAAREPVMTLVEDLSHAALRDLEACDAYLLDGDHNYFTVVGELEAIAATSQAAGTFPLLVLQDLAWPSGHRDQYYDAAGLPPSEVRPHDYGGVRPWERRTGPGGFRGDGHFAFATEEGGPRNGVLQGLEDFLAGTTGWESIAIPCIFGLAVVYRADAPWADAVRAAVGPFDDHPLLARLEANRILLYLRVLELQDELERQRRRAADSLTAAEADRDRLLIALELAGEARRVAEEERDAAVARTVAAPAAPPSAGGLRAALASLAGR